MQLTPLPTVVAHGSNLNTAIKHYGGNASDWLDLSSAVSPYSWWSENSQKAPFSTSNFHDLPYVSDSLKAAVESYYGCSGLVVSGSQAAIKVLPRCVNSAAVWITKGSYGEHAASWLAAGHRVIELSSQDIRTAFERETALPDVLVVVNPDNPSGEVFSPDELIQWAHVLKAREGLLVCDEAFIDASPEMSLVSFKMPSNIVVFRSLGKFFGLAGVRFGVVFATLEIRQLLSAHLGHWAVSSPSLWVAEHALQDQKWHKQQRARLHQLSQSVASLLAHENIVGIASLFITLQPRNAGLMQQGLAEQQIWTRCFPQQNLLRLGLPLPKDHERLESAFGLIK
jgi:cobalamin biosynthetic protein CobC